MKYLTTALVLAAGAMVIGCRSGTEPPEPFGFHYQVVGQPDPPALEGATVSLTVSYGGCGPDHEFVVRRDMQPGATTIWLQKTTPDQPCDALFEERRSFTLPQQAAAATTLVLLAPDGSSYQLRP